MGRRRKNRFKVLIVEDDLNIRNILQDLLHLEGHTVVAAGDAEEALEFLQTRLFDVMITDLGLPGMSGCDLALAARRLQRPLAVISISSWQGRETEKRAVQCGIDISIWKPFRFDQIIEAIKKLTLKETRPRQTAGC